MNILFISSVNLTLNPRVLKELQLAYKLKHKVTFIGFKSGDWSDANDCYFIKDYSDASFIYLDAGRKNLFKWVYISLLHLISKIVWPIKQKSLLLCAIAHSKKTFALIKYFKKTKPFNYDLVIGHTLGALYPAKYLAGKCKCNYAFDVEDYHPGEKIEKDILSEIRRRETLMKRILPSASYVTSASSLISTAVKNLIPNIDITTIPNFFPAREFKKPVIQTSAKIKLVWFSQNINSGRGLELILTIWKEAKEFCEITLIGKLDKIFYNDYLKDHTDIIIKSPVSQKQLHQDLSLYDIGLAIDIDGADYNRQLAITNKILAYFQSGLFIIATNTPAQQEFIEQHPSHGVTTAQSQIDMLNTIKKVYLIKEEIRSKEYERFINASNYSWEKESIIIKDKWESISKV